MSGWIAAALCDLGVDARVGEVEGEYCPGEYSVNARGALKLMGVGQRIVRGAAHVGGVLVVGRSDRTRRVLEPVYRLKDVITSVKVKDVSSNSFPGDHGTAVVLFTALAPRRSSTLAVQSTSYSFTSPRYSLAWRAAAEYRLPTGSQGPA